LKDRILQQNAEVWFVFPGYTERAFLIFWKTGKEWLRIPDWIVLVLFSGVFEVPVVRPGRFKSGHLRL
jgi:hypothetical protein